MKRTLIKLIIATIVIAYSIPACYAQETVVTPLPTNSKIKNDFAPFLLDSVLFFTSNRKHELFKSYLDQDDNWLYRIYKVNILPNDRWSKETIFSATDFTKLNTGSIWIKNDWSKIYMTQNQISSHKESKGKKNLLGIFAANTEGSIIDNIKPFEHNSARDYSTAHPTFTPDGRTMFFVSNENSGFGESDIYKCNLVDGKWSDPENLGSQINTKGKEIFPFYHPSGKLYFSSNGRNANNEFDIYISSYDGKEWSRARALESPINSNSNDFSCYISDSETEGYFASDREGVDNIYHFKIPFPSFPNATEEVEDIFCFTLFENGPYQSDTLPYKYRWTFSDGISELGLEVDHCFPGAGDYSVNLSVFDTLQNVDLFSVATYELPLENTQQIKIESIDTMRVNTTYTISAANSELKDFVPEDYYWLLDDKKTAKGVTINHIFRTIGSYTIICGVTSVDNPQYKLATKKTVIVIE